MNPMDVLYSWQTVLLAAVIVGFTQAFKASAEALLVSLNRGPVKTGKELRGQVAWIDKVALPLFPLVLGALLAAFISIRPDALVTYVTDHAHGSKWAYAMWGAAVGQFADYLYQRAKRLIPGGDPAARNTPSPAAPVGAPADPVPAVVVADTALTDPVPAPADPATPTEPPPDPGPSADTDKPTT